jgi:hypothetical protein
LPAAAPITQRPDRARLPVMMFRQCDRKVRRDGSGVANGQPKQAVDERGGVQGASELKARERRRVVAKGIVYLRSEKEKRRWRKEKQKHDRLGGRDKRAQRALRSIDCFCLIFWRASHVAAIQRTVCVKLIILISMPILHVAGCTPESPRARGLPST